MESLEKQLICPICLEIFTKPVVILPCQHNLCRKCANDVFQASNPYLTTRSGSTVSSGGRFRCPSCRHEVVLDRHGVYGLQRNLLVENIIDMYNQGSTSRPAPERQLEPRCETHEEEKINIYCVSCRVPTCSLCKVFGPHRDCMVAPLEAVCTQQKAELTDCISSLVGTNERTQAIISQLEDTCRTVDESGRRQKSQVCEACDQLFARLEERKAALTLRISCEQEEKLLYVRSLSSKYREHLESTASLLESSLRALDTKEMALFLLTATPLLQKMVEGSVTSHLDQVAPGYENMDHLTGSFEPQRRALMGVDFIKLDEDDDDDDDEDDDEEEEEVAEERPSEAPPTMTSSTNGPAPPSSSQAPPTTSPAPQEESEDGPKHIFSFSWLNQK
ncbi:hypothetical protein CgunFtcFv8_024049 [Champsocephalus gunnari]|uniref:Tripartite motif-containing protein 54 n=1 Tax=Champsocephalus gunnari TaxID=52237 RepID=A0AAN8HQC5_CHAGU|nr:hypothetical protein CgunFtcFv8_024049 [Champsocephalus gunnari]